MYKDVPGLCLVQIADAMRSAIGEQFGMPLAYDEAADRDSWERMKEAFREVFGA